MSPGNWLALPVDGLEIRDHPGFAAGINGQVSVQPNETNH
jgi:hypothetical protein